MKNTKRTLRMRRRILAPLSCYFCEEKKQPYFGEINTLQRFLTERGKIQPRTRSGLCAKHQRATALNIKYARHLALLPFVSRG